MQYLEGLCVENYKLMQQIIVEEMYYSKSKLRFIFCLQLFSRLKIHVCRDGVRGVPRVPMTSMDFFDVILILRKINRFFSK